MARLPFRRHAASVVPARQPVLPWLAPLRPYAAVGTGGLLGSTIRFAISTYAVTAWGAGFPWGTLLVNVAGSFLIGLYLTLDVERFAQRATPRLFFATGFCGGMTTFSVFSLEAITLASQKGLLAATAYVLASLVCALAAVVAGTYVARAAPGAQATSGRHRA